MNIKRNDIFFSVFILVKFLKFFNYYLWIINILLFNRWCYIIKYKMLILFSFIKKNIFFKYFEKKNIW